MKRLKRIVSVKEILLVKAEEHFVLVQSGDDQELVAYRFGDALQDLKYEDGYQVHRSFWVRRSGVVRTNDTGSTMTIDVKNGVSVPVSRPYHALVRQVF
ncbi:MAG: LytTR family DNA-binding domain-containing protein [Pseudomonadota bacterium]